MTIDLDDELLIQRAGAVYSAARSLYETTPHWLVFFREVFGVRGLISEAFATSEERDAFAETMHYADVQSMLQRLRDAGAEGASDSKESTRVITLRIPASMHETIRKEAYERQVSMNRYLIDRLLED